MQFIRTNINKTYRNGELNVSNVAVTNIGGGGGSSSLSGNFLPAVNNGDGSYTVDISKIVFTGNLIGEGEITAYGQGSTSGDTPTGSVTIYDGLDSVAVDAALSANQGRILREMIQAIEPSSILLAGLEDVTLTNLADEQILKYDAASKKWVNGDGTKVTWTNIEGKPAALTDANIAKWNENNHTHTNKTTLDKITEANLTSWNNKLDKTIWDKAFYFDSAGDLRAKVNAWSKITQQTPQACMGYVGQHLVSVVTGYPGGKSGARGYDLVIDDERHGEIKTCYRVDQLGSCNACGAVVSSLETECAVCRSTSINRKDDSKWLIAIRNNDEFAKLLDPYRYYFVLFEFESIYDSNNNDIIASIWEVDPKSKGFAYCMIDYYLNIRSQSTSKAPFNMWPHMLKFALTEPTLIYRSKITNDGNIITDVFPSKNNTYSDVLLPLSSYSGSTTISVANIKNVIKKYSPSARVNGLNKEKLLQLLEDIRKTNNITNADLCNKFADEIYLPKIVLKKADIPLSLRSQFIDLR